MRVLLDSGLGGKQSEEGFWDRPWGHQRQSSQHLPWHSSRGEVMDQDSPAGLLGGNKGISEPLWAFLPLRKMELD